MRAQAIVPGLLLWRVVSAIAMDEDSDAGDADKNGDKDEGGG